MKMIGLFGGTFNPVHIGHIKVAEEVITRLPLDGILFIPSYIPPHKNRGEVVPVRHRLRMVEIACQGHPSWQVSDVEARRRGPSYSIETLRRMKKAQPGDQFFFIVGTDAFLEIETWKDYELLIQECSFVIVKRLGFAIELVKKVIDKIKPASLIVLKKTDILESGRSLSVGLYVLEAETPDVSSTEIRKRLKVGLPVTGLVPPGVEEYIEKYKLYR